MVDRPSEGCKRAFPRLTGMPPRLRRSSLLLLATVPVLLALTLVVLPHLNPEVELFKLHSLLVGTVACVAVLLSTLTCAVGLRQRNLQVVLLSLASASLAMVYAVHGLASPELGVPGVSPLPGLATAPMPGMAGHAPALPLAAQLGALLSACWLCLSTCPSDSAALRGLLRLRGVLLAFWMTGLAGLTALLLLAPQLASSMLEAPGMHPALAVGTLLLCGVTARRSWLSWRYSRFPLQLGVVYAAIWLSGAQLILLVGPAWTISWWIYHVLLVGVTAAISVGLTLQNQRSDLPLGIVLRSLWNNHPDDLLAAGISPSVQALVIKTETHDPDTAGHSYRVALHALRLARACGLSPEALRAVTQGGIVHDLGKLDVPGEVLNVPGRLSAHQWTLIQQHPLHGYERCRALGFLPEELSIVRSHHERWDGKGYPDGLAGGQIPELARLLSIADVYDALTSRRSYREPWSHEQANTYIFEQTGQMFDPALTLIWLRLPQLDLSDRQLPTWTWRWRVEGSSADRPHPA
jgi:HD-GYP domain-containing protein (c-di-GMP phosphodiesterase class II)